MTTKQRERMTWAAGRKASAPPATPGYNVEDQDHPAKNQPDPDMHQYENGDTSGWKEDPKKPPYPQGNPPSTPGYDVEDKDHPAHKEMPRVSLTAAVKRRANLALRLAALQLKGHKVTKAQIDDHAMDLMELGDTQLKNMLARFGGGFLAEEEEAPKEACGDDLDTLLIDETPDVPFVADDLDELLADDEPPAEEPKEAGKFSMEDVMSAIKKLSDEVQEMKGSKKADQNDPKGPTLAPKPKTEDEARKPEVTAANDPLVKEFDSYDTKKCGFLYKKEWKGSKAVFAALDSDKDGIIARADIIKACTCGEEEEDKTEKKADEGLDPDELAMLAEMTAPEAEHEEPDGDEPTACEAEGEEEPAPTAEDESGMFSMTHDPMGLADEGTPGPTSADDALLEEIFGGKVAKKAEDDEEEDPKDKKGKKAKKSEDEEDEPAEDKKGKKAKKSEDEEEPDGDEEKKGEDEEEPKEEKKASKTASQRPQPRKVNPGVKKVGNVTKTAAARSELDELSKMWATDPDVSEVFK